MFCFSIILIYFVSSIIRFSYTFDNLNESKGINRIVVSNEGDILSKVFENNNTYLDTTLYAKEDSSSTLVNESYFIHELKDSTTAFNITVSVGTYEERSSTTQDTITTTSEIAYKELERMYLESLESNQRLYEELMFLKDKLELKEIEFQRSNHELVLLKSIQKELSLLMDDVNISKDDCHNEKSLLTSQIELIQNDLSRCNNEVENHCYNSNDYQQCKSLLVTSINDNNQLISNVKDLTSNFEYNNRKLELCESRLTILKNELTISYLQNDNCILEKNITSIEKDEIINNLRNNRISSDENNVSTCYNLLYEKSNYYKNYILKVWENYIKPILINTYIVFNSILNRSLNFYNYYMKPFYNDIVLTNVKKHVIPYYNNVIVAKMQNYPISLRIKSWYVSNVYPIIIDYIEPLYDYIVRKANVILYYVVNYYNHENMSIYLYKSTMNILKISYDFINSSEIMSNNLEGLIILAVAFVILYVLFQLRTYVFGLGAAILMIIFSPILLFVYLFIELPKKYLFRKKIKVRRRIVRQKYPDNNSKGSFVNIENPAAVNIRNIV